MEWAYANCVFTEQNVTTVLNAAALNPASHQSKIHGDMYVYWAYAEQKRSWLYVHSCYVTVNRHVIRAGRAGIRPKAVRLSGFGLEAA